MVSNNKFGEWEGGSTILSCTFSIFSAINILHWPISGRRAGIEIMKNLGDEPRLVSHYGPGPWVKMAHNHQCFDGRRLEIHYFSNRRGLNVELKFNSR